MHLEAEINKAALNELVSLPLKELWGGSASAIPGAGILLAPEEGPGEWGGRVQATPYCPAPGAACELSAVFHTL